MKPTDIMKIKCKSGMSEEWKKAYLEVKRKMEGGGGYDGHRPEYMNNVKNALIDYCARHNDPCVLKQVYYGMPFLPIQTREGVLYKMFNGLKDYILKEIEKNKDVLVDIEGDCLNAIWYIFNDYYDSVFDEFLWRSVYFDDENVIQMMNYIYDDLKVKVDDMISDKIEQNKILEMDTKVKKRKEAILNILLFVPQAIGKFFNGLFS